MIRISLLEASLISSIYIVFILISRKLLNKKSFKSASKILWGIVFLRLIFPYSIRIPLNKLEYTGTYSRVVNSTIDLITGLNRVKNTYLIDNINDYFPKIARLLTILLIGIYIMFKLYRANKALSGSLLVEDNAYIDSFLHKYNLRRDIQVFINDDLKYPITYGILKPKIIIQSRLIDDKGLLKPVLAHEITHIKKFDALWNFLRNILLCIYWYNPLIWVMAIYLNEDIEILCDKLTIEKIGDNEENKKNYCIAMLNLIQEEENKPILGLNLHPNVERMMILKNWKVKKTGIILLVLMIIITSTAFISAGEESKTITVASREEEELIINVDDRTREITTEEYNEVLRGKDRIKPMKADISDSVTLDSYGNKSYSFNMSSWTSASHKRFVTNISNVSSKGSVDFKVLIEEDGNLIYSKNYSNGIRLQTTNAKDNANYKVTIINTSNAKLEFDISIVSYED